jgi:hypothetical protein
MYHGSRWGMPVAMAATLLVVLTAVLHVGMSDNRPVPEVTVQDVSQPVEYPPAAPGTPMAAAAPAEKAAAPAAQKAEGAAMELQSPGLARNERATGVPSGLVSAEEASRYEPPAPPPPSTAARARTDTVADAQASTASGTGSQVIIAQPPPSEAERAVANASSTPAWRRNAQSWLAEIERLRLEGKTAQADAEQAEYNRQHRAYAVGPDR